MEKLKNIPMYERPYEKMLVYGEKKLSDSELLSIIIRTGTKKYSSIEIAKKLISKNASLYNDLRFLQECSIMDFMNIDGIGKVKAIELKAVGEIAKRIENPINSKKLFINSRNDVAKLFMEELRNERFEVVKLVMLNNKNIIQKITTIAIGNSNGIVFDIKQVLSEPLKLQIPKIIIVHNHPSGNPEPSKNDIEFTKKLYEVSKIMGIELLDHIIIGDGVFQNINLKG